jgi:hypothetical protein
MKETWYKDPEILIFSASVGEEIPKLGRSILLYPRETREGWAPLLTVELRQMGTQSVQMKGVLHWLVCWALQEGTKDFCPAVAALVSPVQNSFFLTVHYFNTFVPIAQQAGQAVVQGRLSLNMCSLDLPVEWAGLIPWGRSSRRAPAYSETQKYFRY